MQICYWEEAFKFYKKFSRGQINLVFKCQRRVQIRYFLTWYKPFPSSWFYYVKKNKRVVIFYSNQKFRTQFLMFFWHKNPEGNCILLPKLFWPTVRKNCSSDRDFFLKFEAEGREFAKILRSLEQFIQTVKGQNNFW